MKVNVKAMADAILGQVKAVYDAYPVSRRKALMVISVGENEASQSYIRSKERACEYCGIPFRHIHFDDTSLNVDILCEIYKANADKEVGGIILQLPLPHGFDENIAQAILPEKDVDGIIKHSKFKPCTPEGVIHIMKQYFGSDLTGKEVLIIGRGKLVGEPLRKMLQDEENCSVAVKHSKSRGQFGGIYSHDGKWDCIVSATPEIQSELDGYYDFRLFIDCGIGRGEDGKLHGNFIPESYVERSAVEAYTPVPGGVGPMTIAMLMFNTLAKTMK